MKKSLTIIALAALVMLAGCKKNDPKPNGTRLFAGIEKHKSDSKTSLDGLQIKWSENDQLYVNNGTTSACFTLVSGAGTTKGEFATEGEYSFAAANNLAVYPYDNVNSISGTTVTMTLPAVQEASGAGSFGNGANPMLGTFSDMDNLTLTSLCGVLCLQLTGDNVDITAIEMVGGPGDKLNGTFTVDYMNPEPTYPTEGTNTVRLNFTEPVTLTSTAQNFYVVLPAGTLNGFTMKVYTVDNKIFSKSTANNVPVSVNTLSTMEPVEVNPYATPLTLEALTDGNIGVIIKNVGGKGGGVYPGSSKGGPGGGRSSNIRVKYSVNGGDTITIYETTTVTTTIPVNAGDMVQFYGDDSSTQFCGDEPKVVLQGAAHTKVYGNIMSLLDEDNYANLTTLPNGSFANFAGLFSENENLTDASGLLLPATTLTGACYYGMFAACTSLTTAPALPATELAEQCYLMMFFGCTSLSTAPALPATTLAGGCYYWMFFGCTSLTTAPALPATELAGGCYSGMFAGCTSLNSVTCLATDISASDCTTGWLEGVATTGTFTKASGSTWPEGSNGIPSGWTVNEQ